VDEKGNVETDGSAMFGAYGIQTHLQAAGLPLARDLGIYHWQFEGQDAAPDEKLNREIFRDGLLYVFCLDRRLTKRSLAHGGTYYRMADLGSHLTAIVEIEPTFLVTATNPVLHVMADQFLCWQENRGTSEEFSIRASGGGFAWRWDGNEGTLSRDSAILSKLLYALNTTEWTPASDLSIATQPSPVDTLISFKRNGAQREITIRYHNGTWHFRTESGTLMQAPFPQLFWSAVADLRGRKEGL
jgi:hypothetical protein